MSPAAAAAASIRLTRNAEGGLLLELFLIAGVCTVLVVRWLLDLTGYPRLGGGGLHVAHLLYGGLLMLAALLLLFRFLDRRIQYTGAVLSGIGFGLFIDEIGKFLTADNDYFFRPAIAIIYVLFVGLFLLLRIAAVRSLSPTESLANALVLLVDGADGTIDARTRQQVVQLLAHADPDHPLRAPLAAYTAGLVERGWLFAAIARAGRTPARLYDAAVANPWFERGLVAVVAIYAVAAIGSMVVVLASGTAAAWTTAPDIAQTGSTVAGALLVVRGVVELPRSRPRAYRWFLRGVLVWLLVTQVFVFYQSQLAGLGGFAADLAAYVVLRYMIGREVANGQHPADTVGSGPDATPTPATA
jgi:hypothetical protein